MKRTTFLYLTVGLLALGAPALRADGTNTTTTVPAHGAHHGDNREFLRAIGLTGAELKGLSKEDRQAKIKSAAESTETALEQKQTAGTITDKEKSDLAMIQKHLQHGKKSATAQ